jgi:hypothetical protein
MLLLRKVEFSTSRNPDSGQSPSFKLSDPLFILPTSREDRYQVMVFARTGKQPFDKQQLFI